MPDLNLQFMRHPITGESKQEEFFFLTCRNQCFSGGYGNGKTYIGCLKSYMLLSTFPGYRMAILRASSVDLKRTTMETFFKICPPEAYSKGGRVDSRNHLKLDNGSEVFWLHLDDYNENMVRGLELNSYLIDQGEEVGEKIFLHLDARIDRWEMVTIPQELNPERYPKNPITGRPKPPAYGMVLCNPDAFSHWIYRRFHPDSTEHTKKRYRKNRYTGETIEYAYSDTHKMVTATSYDNPSLSEETLANMESRGEEFKRRFVLGQWGIPGGAIHVIPDASKLYNFPRAFLDKVIRRGKLYTAMDHGDASPTCVLWFARFEHWIFVFQEYYKSGTPISEHRKNLGFLNIYQFSGEKDGIHLNTINVCDPSMLNKTQQKKGGITTLADEYITSEYQAPPWALSPADNSEFISRSRINEALRPHPEIPHPITGELNSPMLYFVMQDQTNPTGCSFVVDQTAAQKYEKIGVQDGEDIYGDDRDEDVTDHAYDPLRYGLVRILQYGVVAEAKPYDFDRTFEGARKRAIRMQRMYKRLSGVNPHSSGVKY